MTPAVRCVLETSLYVEDLERSARFYQQLFGFERLLDEERLCALNVEGGQVLLLFKKGASRRPGNTPEGSVPSHDGAGELHLAFGVALEDVDLWKQKLYENGIAIESLVHWQSGGTSIYFRDPDNHSVELASPGTWTIY